MALPTAQKIEVMARYKPRSLNENVSHMMTLTMVPMPDAPRP